MFLFDIYGLSLALSKINRLFPVWARRLLPAQSHISVDLPGEADLGRSLRVYIAEPPVVDD